MGDSVSGVGVLDKAVLVLESLEAGPLTLNDLAHTSSLPRATAYRLAVALEKHGLAARDAEGRFRLGDRLADLGRAAEGGQRLSAAAAPALAALRDETSESTQLYIADGDRRVCVAATESPHSLRTIVAVGAALPMDRGSAAKALAGDPARLTRGWAQSVEEREPGVASVSAPVRLDGRVVAAVSVSGPIERTTRQPGRRYGPAVVEAARSIERALAGS